MATRIDLYSQIGYDREQRSFLYDVNIGTQRKAGERKDTSM
jgi:hypothetical protein